MHTPLKDSSCSDTVEEQSSRRDQCAEPEIHGSIVRQPATAKQAAAASKAVLGQQNAGQLPKTLQCKYVQHIHLSFLLGYHPLWCSSLSVPCMLLFPSSTHHLSLSHMVRQVNGRIIRKRIHVRIEHIQPSRCREDFLRRRETNDRIKHEAKVKGGEDIHLNCSCSISCKALVAHSCCQATGAALLARWSGSAGVAAADSVTVGSLRKAMCKKATAHLHQQSAAVCSG